MSAIKALEIVARREDELWIVSVVASQRHHRCPGHPERGVEAWSTDEYWYVVSDILSTVAFLLELSFQLFHVTHVELSSFVSSKL
jgi:hypothetical protein